MNSLPVKKITAAAVFIICFLSYAATLNPAFHANDSPETTACSVTLGIQHPPGYPLFALAGKIFSMIPEGSKAFRVNLTAAFFASLAVMLLFLALFDTFRKKENTLAAAAASLSAAFAFAFTFTFWSEALSSKGGIYTMNAFFLALLCLVAFEFEKKGMVRHLYLFSFIFGLSLTNHWESMGVTAPAFALFFFLVIKKRGFGGIVNAKSVLTALFFGALGVTAYAYLLIRSHTAVLNWGDPTTLKELLYVIFREQYADLEKAKSISVVLMQMKKIGHLLAFEFSAAGLVIASIGAVEAFRKTSKERFMFVSAVIVTFLLVLAFYLNLKEEMLWIIDVFMIPVYFCAAFFIAGFIMLVLRLTKAPLPAAVLLAAALPVYQAAANFTSAGQQRYFYAYDFGMNVIKSVDLPSVAMLEGDFYVMPMMYFKYVDKKTQFCPVTTLFLYKEWGLKNMKRECPGVAGTVDAKLNYSGRIASLVNTALRDKYVYASIFKRSYEEFFPAGNSLLVPSGLMMKTTFDRQGEKTNVINRLKMLSYRNLLGAGAKVNSTTALCLSNYSSAHMEAGNFLSSLGLEAQAEKYLRRGVEIATPPTKAEAWTHLGVLYAKKGDNAAAVEAYKSAVKAKPSLAEAHSNMAGIYNNMKKYDEAIASASEALKHKPGFSEAYNNMSISYYNKGDIKKAVELMELAVKYGPNNAAAVNNLKIMKGGLK